MRNLCLVLFAILSLSTGSRKENYKSYVHKVEILSIEITLDVITISPKPVLKLPKHVQDYITEYYPIAACMEQEFGIPAVISLGVGGLESGWGTNKNAKRTHNYHGLYGGPHNKSYKTKQEGFRDFAKFLLRYKRYKPLKGVTDYKEYCKLLHTTGFNPYPHYPAKLQRIIEYAGLQNL